MLSLYGGQGMGTAGLGAGASPMVPAMAGMNPQVMAMLQAMGGGAPTSMQAPTPGAAPGPMNAGAAGTPMAGYIGAGGNPGMMHPMQPAPVAPNPEPQAPGNPIGQIGQNMAGMAQIQALVNKMKGAQSGVAANLPPAQNPESTGGAWNWLQSLFAGGGGGAVPPAGGLT